jgi:hypothetical protein
MEGFSFVMPITGPNTGKEDDDDNNLFLYKVKVYSGIIKHYIF